MLCVIKTMWMVREVYHADGDIYHVFRLNTTKLLDPIETDSIYASREKADRRAAELNAMPMYRKFVPYE